MILRDARYQTTGSIINYSKVIRYNSKTFFALGLSAVFTKENFVDNLVFIEQENFDNVSFYYPDINLGLLNKQIIIPIDLYSGISFSYKLTEPITFGK